MGITLGRYSRHFARCSLVRLYTVRLPVLRNTGVLHRECGAFGPPDVTNVRDLVCLLSPYTQQHRLHCPSLRKRGALRFTYPRSTRPASRPCDPSGGTYFRFWLSGSVTCVSGNRPSTNYQLWYVKERLTRTLYESRNYLGQSQLPHRLKKRLKQKQEDVGRR